MQRLTREGNIVYTHSAAHEPRMTVSPGEQFQVETELATGEWLQSIDSDPKGRASPFPYVNPTTGPV